MRNLFETPVHCRWADCVDDAELLRAWKNGLDSYEIAQKFFMPEHEVCRRLNLIRERVRQYERA